MLTLPPVLGACPGGSRGNAISLSNLISTNRKSRSHLKSSELAQDDLWYLVSIAPSMTLTSLWNISWTALGRKEQCHLHRSSGDNHSDDPSRKVLLRAADPSEPWMASLLKP
eukprot:11732690-Heterocapsa_arctica.AAC.1